MTAQLISLAPGVNLLHNGVNPGSSVAEALRRQQFLPEPMRTQGQPDKPSQDDSVPLARSFPGTPDSEPSGEPPAQGQMQISDTALRRLSDTEPRPTDPQKIQAQAAQLASHLDSAFLKAGIDTREPVRINIHPLTGIPFVGEHPDKLRIQNLLDDTPDLVDQIRNVSLLASYHYQVRTPGPSVADTGATDTQTQPVSTTGTSSEPASPLFQAFMQPDSPVQSWRMQQALALYRNPDEPDPVSLLYQPLQGLHTEQLPQPARR